MIIIINDDDAYLSWLEANPDGFVINAENPPSPSTLRLHRAGCRHISTPERSNWTTTGYLKVCSNVPSELEEWAEDAVGSMPACGVCRPTESRPPVPIVEPSITGETNALPFDTYPHGGRQLLGRRSVTNSRRGYGLFLRRLTNQSRCAYCGINLFDTYEHWLLLQVDHVVPTTMGKRLGVPSDWLEDYCNLVFACSACNTFANQFDDLAVTEPPDSLEAFVALRNRVFLMRRPLILKCQERERSFFDEKPWTG